MKHEILNLALRKRRLIVLAGSLLTAQIACIGAIIPAGRSTTWQGHVGVEGGIPNSSNMTVYATVSPAQGVAGINNALANCPSNQVVQLTAGNYTVNSLITFAKNGVILRGAGPGVTTLTLSGTSGVDFRPPFARFACIVQGNGSGCYGSGPDNVVSWTGGFSQGSTSITLSSTVGLFVGTMLFLDQIEDGNDVQVAGLCSNCGRPGPRSQQQIVKVRAINGTTVTISDPIMMPNWRASQSPQAWWQNQAAREMCGLENLTINGQNVLNNWQPNGWGVLAQMSGNYNCWMKNIEGLYGGGGFQFYLEACAHCELRHCTIRFNHGTSHLSYGMGLNNDSSCLVEDNISVDSVTLVNAGTCSGNAFTYNYFTNCPFLANGTTPWQQQMFDMHDGHQCMNLFEGNYGNGWHSDDYHGSGGYDTVFRNRFTSEDRLNVNNAICISLENKQRYMNIVGNVLGKTGWTTCYEKVGCGLPSIIGNENGLTDPVVYQTLYWHGNYDQANNAILWASSNADHTLPNSLVYASKPAFFGTLPWPPFDPANGLALASNPSARTNIPAGYRYVYGVDPPSGPVNQPPVASARATPSAGPAPLTVAFSSAGSYDPEGVSLSYSWSFGDGITSTTANPSHTYTTLGSYSARLSVSDGVNTAASNIAINVTQ